jgi:endoglucanase
MDKCKMKLSSLYKLVLFVGYLLLLPGCSLNLKAEPEIFIRFNQLGFFPNDLKTAVVLSYNQLDGKSIAIFSTKNREKVWSGSFDKNLGAYGNFPFSYSIDFSKLKNTGEYYIQFAQQKTFSFKINENIYNGVVDSLLKFFKVQRCGYTSPYLHKTCHIADATSLIEANQNKPRQVDVTGGWHDAGDYVKFLNTTAFATYMLMFSYEFDPVKFGTDNNKNGVPDILEEAKIGLDWMLRCYFTKNKLITQVQDLRDHDVGWRLPEDDKLGFDRPAFVGMGKNLIGIYSAAMALASRIWQDKMKNNEFSAKCLKAAEDLYSLRNQAANIDSSGSGMYLDKKYEGKLALGAAELYLTTHKPVYLSDASSYAESAGADYWWSWGDINSLAHYRLAKFIPRFTEYLEKNLNDFNKRKDKNIFGKGTELSWGTNVTLIGITLQNILYKRLTNSSRYDSLATYQRDFIFGRNAWGVSFINGFGKNYTKNLHHQIARIIGKLPGGFAAGPATKSFIDKQKINYEQSDIYAKFQTENDYYRDDRMDYITNEPTITGNATAIFVFGNMNGKK